MKNTENNKNTQMKEGSLEDSLNDGEKWLIDGLNNIGKEVEPTDEHYDWRGWINPYTVVATFAGIMLIGYGIISTHLKKKSNINEIIQKEVPAENMPQTKTDTRIYTYPTRPSSYNYDSITVAQDKLEESKANHNVPLGSSTIQEKTNIPSDAIKSNIIYGTDTPKKSFTEPLLSSPILNHVYLMYNGSKIKYALYCIEPRQDTSMFIAVGKRGEAVPYRLNTKDFNDFLTKGDVEDRGLKPMNENEVKDYFKKLRRKERD